MPLDKTNPSSDNAHAVHPGESSSDPSDLPHKGGWQSAHEKHHDLALKLLVGRSLPEGLPWGNEEDRKLVIRERVLWAQLTDEEKAAEQESLNKLWHGPRTVTVNRRWGAWTRDLEDGFQVQDRAFGVPSQDYRPYPRGVMPGKFPGQERVLAWLWERGFQVIEVNGDETVFVVPQHRVVQEADRLLGLIGKIAPNREWLPFDEAVEGLVSQPRLRILSTYDPVGGIGLMKVKGLTDELLG